VMRVSCRPTPFLGLERRKLLGIRRKARLLPLGWRAHIADDRLPALGNGDVLDDHALLAPRSIVLQGRLSGALRGA
jgi:hypothetical protein